MGDLPIEPGIGDKRPRGDDDHDNGSSLPPNLRGNVGNMSGNQAQGNYQGQMQQWQGAPSMMAGGLNMTAANAGLDALYIGDLNWVLILLYRSKYALTLLNSGQLMRISVVLALKSVSNWS
jgi:hypothetical protein